MDENTLVKTYIPNLDDELGGGIPLGHVVLVIGDTGTMKSTLCYSILLNNAREKDVFGLYLSTKEGQMSLNNQMNGLKMDVDEYAATVMFLDIATMRVVTEISQEAWFQLIKTSIMDLKNLNDCKLLVIDSLESLYLISNLKDDTVGIYDFLRWIQSIGMNVFLISARSLEDVTQDRWSEAQLVDGIISLDMGYETSRNLRIFKMRGMNHNREPLPFDVGDDGLRIVL